MLVPYLTSLRKKIFHSPAKIILQKNKLNVIGVKIVQVRKRLPYLMSGLEVLADFVEVIVLVIVKVVIVSFVVVVVWYSGLVLDIFDVLGRILIFRLIGGGPMFLPAASLSFIFQFVTGLRWTKLSSSFSFSLFSLII